MRVHILGGFLGAGKTSLARALAEHLRAQGEHVALVTNDQGRALVDTSLCRGDAIDVREVAGGCFCCRYSELEDALFAAASAGATVTIAEAVGSCTDLVATVLAPLGDRHPDRFEVAPLAVVVDPWRVVELRDGRLDADVAYLFQKQIEEADIVLLSRADLSPPDVRAFVRSIRPDVAVVNASGPARIGLAEWLSVRPGRPANPLLIDYDRYAAAEALLGWCNARVRIDSEQAFSPGDLARRFLERMADAPIAHLKLAGVEPGGGQAAIVRAGDAPRVQFDGVAPARHAEWLVNARIALEPEDLVKRLKAALAGAADRAQISWEEVEAFRPARPVPQHRYSYRCGSGDDASCCAAFYDRPDVRALLGDSWHPGGVELTLAMGEQLGLTHGGRILDIACGKGVSLSALLERWPVTGVGVDAEVRENGSERLSFLRGDAHQIPAEDGSFDAVLCECALSTFRDQPRALREVRRVLRPGGRVAISDMAIEGEVPASLKEWVHTGTCLAGALGSDAYALALADAGFLVVKHWDASDGLRELLRRIKRNLVGAAFAAASGGVDVAGKVDMKRARDVIREAEATIDRGVIRYTALIAERPRD